MTDPIEVIIPQETVNDLTARVVGWKVKSGTRVTKDQVICELETSKAVMEISAPEAGVIEYSASEGDEVPIGAVLCRISRDGSRPSQVTAAREGASPEGPRAIPQESDVRPARFTPLARRLLDELGLSGDDFPPGALVRRQDVLNRADRRLSDGRGPAVDTSTPQPQDAQAQPQRSGIPVAGVPVEWSSLPRRKRVEVQVLSGGQAGTLPSSVTTSCRSPRVNGGRMGGSMAGLTPLVVFEVARLLRRYPALNAVYAQGRVGHYQAINVGWAIDGGKGLVVPVVRNADTKGYSEIVGIMEGHIESYLEDSLAPTDFSGGTFTVTDLSEAGVRFFQPLISSGQSAILGVGRDSGVHGEGALYLTLAFDHQVAEGRLAAQFLEDLGRRIEAHAASSGGGVEGTPSEAFCLLCQRDAATLQKQRVVLVRSEVPRGLVCSNCLAGL